MKKLSCQLRVSLCGRHPLIAGLFLIGLMACLAVGVSTARAQNYSVDEMGIVDGMKSCEPAAMNNQGQVTGTASAGAETCAFRYYKDTMEDLGGFNSRGFSINASGLAVGDAIFHSPYGPVSHAALFTKGGKAEDLGVLKGQVFSRANGINALNQVVGFSSPKRDIEESRAFIWTAETGMLDIGTLGGSYAQANAINESGFVTGTAQTMITNRFMPMATHAFVYQPLSPWERFTEPMRDLGTLGGDSSYGMSINASNHVAGYSKINNTDERVHAFFHDGKKMADLGSLGGVGASDYSVALAVNNSDQVVGYSYFGSSTKGQPRQVAFLWTRTGKHAGEMINLNERIGGAAKTLWLLSATSINDSGQIAASAYDSKTGTVRAVTLTPIFPPSLAQ